MRIKSGDKWLIAGFSEDVPDAFARKLFSLGLVPGAELTLVRVAPLGDPVEVRVHQSSYALRKSELQMLRLTPLGQENL